VRSLSYFAIACSVHFVLSGKYSLEFSSVGVTSLSILSECAHRQQGV